MFKTSPRSQNSPQPTSAINRNQPSFLIKHKSTIAGVSAAAFGLASYMMPPPANAMCLGASRFLAGASALSYLRDNFEKVANKAQDISNTTQDTTKQASNQIASAMGQEPLQEISLTDIPDHRNTPVNEPLMSKEQQEFFDKLKNFLTKEATKYGADEYLNVLPVLLYGPPGTGKTMLLDALQNYVPADYNFSKATIEPGQLSARGIEKMDLLEEKIMKKINSASNNKKECILLMADEVDATLINRETTNDNNRIEIVNRWLTLFNNIKREASKNPNVVLVIGQASNRLDAIDGAVRDRATLSFHVDYLEADLKKQLITDIINNKLIDGYTQQNKTDLIAQLDSNSALKQALNANLSGRTIDGMFKKTIIEMVGQTFDANNFATKFAELMTAEEQRVTDEENKKAAERAARTGISGAIGAVTQAIQELKDKTGDNSGIKTILDDMGKKFEAMQRQNTQDTQKIVTGIAQLVQKIEDHSKKAEQAKDEAKIHADSALESSKSASTSSNNAVNHARKAKGAAKYEVDQKTLEYTKFMEGIQDLLVGLCIISVTKDHSGRHILITPEFQNYIKKYKNI